MTGEADKARRRNSDPNSASRYGGRSGRIASTLQKVGSASKPIQKVVQLFGPMPEDRVGASEPIQKVVQLFGPMPEDRVGASEPIQKVVQLFGPMPEDRVGASEPIQKVVQLFGPMLENRASLHRFDARPRFLGLAAFPDG